MLILLFGVFGIISNYTGIEIYHNTFDTIEWLFRTRFRECAGKYKGHGYCHWRVAWRTNGRPRSRDDSRSSSVFTWWIYSFFLWNFYYISWNCCWIFREKTKTEGEENHSLNLLLLTGITLETIQMLIILVAAKPFEQAWNLVQIIGSPYDSCKWIRNIAVHVYLSIHHAGRCTNTCKPNKSCF